MQTNIVVDARHAALNNDDSAKLRECTQMAVLAWTLAQQRHDVFFLPNNEWQKSNRQDWFASHLSDSFQTTSHWSSHADLLITSEHYSPEPISANIKAVYKTTVGIDYDCHLLHNSDLLIAAEYNPIPEVDQHPCLFPMPFPVHDLVLQQLASLGLLQQYLQNNLQPIRRMYRAETCNNIGFLGTGMYGRKAIGQRFSAISPLPCDFHFYDGDSPFSAHDYLTRIGTYFAGLHISGDTPKANRFCELVLLGIPVITVPVRVRCDPPITRENTILLRSWNDHDTLIDRLEHAETIAENATRDYLSGWSPMGQARMLLTKLGIA